MSDSDDHILLTPKSVQTGTLGAFGFGGVGLMLGGPSVSYGGCAVAVIFCGLIFWLHFKDIIFSLRRRRISKHIIFPVSVIFLIAICGLVVFFRESLDKVSFEELLKGLTSEGWSGGWRVISDPETWFVIIALSWFWVAQADKKPQKIEVQKPDFGPDIAAAIEKLKAQLVQDANVPKALVVSPMGEAVVVQPMRPTPALAQWSKATSYSLGEAASLWVDEIPPGSDETRSAEAQAVLARLKAAVLDGQLIPVPEQGIAAMNSRLNGPTAGSGTRASRDAFIMFATIHQEWPRFLFPEGRPTKPAAIAEPAEPKVNPNLGPDYAAWDGLKRMELWQAACLWNEETPPNEIVPLKGSAQARLQMLQQAIQDDELKFLGVMNVFGPLTVVNPDIEVSRAALKAFAKLKGETPKFLFPTER